MSETNQEEPLAALVGRNIRNLRVDLDLSQDELAGTIRLAGLMWTRSTLAKVERGERRVSLEEVFPLALALMTEVGALLDAGDEDEWVRLSPRAAVRARELRPLIEGQSEGRTENWRVPAFTPRAPGKLPRSDWLDLDHRDLILAESFPGRDTEEKAARRLGVDPIDVARAAVALWGDGMIEEREQRLAYATFGPNVDVDFSRDLEGNRARALRGHITRALLGELREELARRFGANT